MTTRRPATDKPLKVRSNVRAGAAVADGGSPPTTSGDGSTSNHNRTLLRLKTGVRAGGIALDNHNRTRLRLR